METEPTRLVSLLNAALAATVGILMVTGVLEEDVGGAITIALGAWVLFLGEWLRSRVTPVGNARLTAEQAATVEIIPENG